MKYKVVLIICVVFAYFSCSKSNEKVKLNWDKIEFESWNLAENYQLEINGSDTIFMNTIFPEKKSFYAILDEDEKSNLFETINEIQFKTFKKEYWDDNVDDGQVFKFKTKLGKTNLSVSIHENIGPKELFQLSKELIKIKKECNFLQVK